MKTAAFKSGTAKKMKKWVRTPNHARQLEFAIRDIQNKNAEELVKAGRASKLSIPNQDTVYAYRVTPTERILFVSREDANIVADIVDTKNEKSLNGLKVVIGKEKKE